MAITVDPEGHAAVGVGLADGIDIQLPPVCVAAGADVASQAAHDRLVAYSDQLYAVISHALLLLADGSRAVQHTAQSLQATDEASAAMFFDHGGGTTAPGLLTLAAVPAPVSAGIPSMPAPALLPGEARAIALYKGPGAGTHRQLAEFWRAQAARLDDEGARMELASVSHDQTWADGVQQGGARIAALGAWFSDTAERARSLASMLDACGGHYDQAKAATHTPEQFTDKRNQLTQAIASYGVPSAHVSTIAAQLSHMQSNATEASATYLDGVAKTTAKVSSPPVAPAIVRTDGDAAEKPDHKDGDSRSKSEIQPGARQAGPTPPGVAIDPNASVEQETLALMMSSGLRALPMAGNALGSVGSALPLSALSGLRQLGASTMAAHSARHLPISMHTSPGVQAAGDTSPAWAGGGGAGGGGHASSMPPVTSASPTAASGPTVASGPAASTATAATAAAASAAEMPASGPGGAGMGMYPSMMGAAMGQPDDASRRDTELFPDRRAVTRPVPNTEAVFGRLARERRTRGKRAGQQEEESSAR